MLYHKSLKGDIYNMALMMNKKSAVDENGLYKKPQIPFATRVYYYFYKLIRSTPILNFAVRYLTYALEGNPVYDWFYGLRIKQKIQDYSPYPQQILFHTLLHCNSDCIMCPFAKSKRPTDPKTAELFAKILPTELVKKVVDESIGKGLQSVVFTGGEPFMDKELLVKIKYVREKLPLVHIHLFSNGSFLNEDRINTLIDVGLNSLTISIDGADSASYESTRTNLSFDRVFGNAKLVQKMKKQRGTSLPLLRLAMITLSTTENKRIEYMKIMKKVGDVVEIHNAHNWGGFIPSDLFNRKSYGGSKEKRYVCHYLYGRVAIASDGKISMCSYDYDKTHVIGDVNVESLERIWQGEKLAEYRQHHLDGSPESIERCKNCTSKFSWWHETLGAAD